MSPMNEYLRLLDSEKVAIAVGQGANQKVFHVAGDLLRNRSEWFKTALKDDWMKDGTINLPTESPPIFEVFLYYIHNRQLTYDRMPNEADEYHTELLQCADLCCFADKHLMHDLLNAVMYWVCSIVGRADRKKFTIPASTLASCVNTLNESCPMRLIIADYVVNRIEHQDPAFNTAEIINNCPGFINTMHASGKALHKSAEGDFPRYRKPVKFKNALRAKASAAVQPESTFSFGSGWDELFVDCHDCGFMIKPAGITPRCEECKDSACQCIEVSAWEFICKACKDA